MDIAYLRNKTAARGVPGYNLDDCEPSGRYLTADTIPNQPAPAGWERGTVSFVNPLRLDHLHGGWRQALSAHYDGRTGKELTASLRADGYDGIITSDHHGYGEIVALQMNEVAPWFKPITHEQVLENDRKNKKDGPRDPYDFTGSPETQYHHRALDSDDLEDIDTRKDSADDWYAEMATRRAQGLPEVDWNTWINRRISYRLAMAWDEWADKITHRQSDIETLGGKETRGRYVIPQAGAFLDYRHDAYHGKPAVFIDGIYTHPDNRNDGVAEAMVRRLRDDHPDFLIDPGYMTPDGQRFHDQMLEKEPEAREFVTAASLLVGPEDAYDENDWFQRHMDHPPLEDPVTADWYHVSPHRMQVGTILAPMHGETPWDDEPYDHGLQNRANWIWIEYDERKARQWQQWVLDHQPECHLYRVQPHLGPFAWNGTADEGWVTDWAEILEEMT